MAEDTPTGTTIDVTVDDDRTVVTVTGTRDAAVIVSSESGERIYLPPEDFADAPATNGPPSTVSPYDGGRDPAEDETTAYGGEDAYGSGGTDAGSDPHGPETDTRVLGVTSTPTGFRIVHPEPVHDVRVVGARD
ncbi:DUF7510 family protein [Halarchaeum nitratireducens]|uniref:Uncharacterized protein n=1 Tax=Halarchaeum nitratireducens TaxID=489913 RepID=A0A830G8W9_9EURY|nr:MULTISPECIES: hypothetical protein [Halarchaeum]MBP2249952.1 hypothetical protein [Halarchaeum solikamskense]GGN09562.1 hypothetical protein GCM10009021_06410 [Halarchaeum nitratireducens]